MIDKSQRLAAKVIGITYLLAFVIVTVGFFRFYAPILVWNNPAETARNIMSHESSYRLYIACNLIYGIGLVVLLAALYVVLRPISRGLALFATFSRLAYACMWFVMLMHQLGVLRVMSGTALPDFDVERVAAFAGLQLATGWDAYYIGLTFYGLSSVVFAYLWFKSRYIPRTLAAWGMLASLFEAVCAGAYLIYPTFGKIVSVNWYELPISLFELALTFWLLVRGLRPPEAV